MQTTQTSINLHEMPIGTTYICRDGSEVTINGYNGVLNYPFKGSNGYTYVSSGRIWSCDEDPKDIMQVKPVAETKPVITVEVGKKYVRRDGKIATVLSGPYKGGRYYTDQEYGESGKCAYVYCEGNALRSALYQPEDFVAEYVEAVVKPAKPSQYETIMQIASSIQEAGGSVSHLHKITLEDFLSICEKNNIEITVKYNKGK